MVAAFLRSALFSKRERSVFDPVRQKITQRVIMTHYATLDRILQVNPVLRVPWLATVRLHSKGCQKYGTGFPRLSDDERFHAGMYE
jgi:hypothetical protein